MIVISNRRFIAVAVLLSVSLLIFGGCSTGDGILEDTTEESKDMEPVKIPEEKPAEEPTELEPVEIREYEGTNLSSVNDFRENSIKGPQQVDIENYTLAITGLVAEPFVGLDRIHANILQMIGVEFGDQADAPAFLAEINNRAFACLFDSPHGFVKLAAAIAPLGMKDVAGQAFAVHAHQYSLVLLNDVAVGIVLPYIAFA